MARLIGAAELQAAAHSVRPISAADIMSKNLVTTSPDTTIGETADLFRQHRFTSLPVVGDDAKFLGVIFQIHLINQARGDAARRGRTYWSALTRILDRNRTKPITARDIMSRWTTSDDEHSDRRTSVYDVGRGGRCRPDHRRRKNRWDYHTHRSHRGIGAACCASPCLVASTGWRFGFLRNKRFGLKSSYEKKPFS